MKHLLNKIKELESRKFDVVISRGSLALHQTQRNQAKSEIIEALYQDLKEALSAEGYSVYSTGSGPILEILNPDTEDQILDSEDGKSYSGFISIQFDAIMKNLETNGAAEEAEYLAEQETKKAKLMQKEQEKILKIQRDAELRAEKTRRREEEIVRAQILREQQKDAAEE